MSKRSPSPQRPRPRASSPSPSPRKAPGSNASSSRRQPDVATIWTPIPRDKLPNLLTHKHAADLPGWLDRVVMTPFWDALVLWVPSWLHPNVLTLCGNACNVLAFAMLVTVCDPLTCNTASSPWWAGAFVAVATFIYQTLDALDGKHARRMGCGSPIGQLWDHGLDAFTWPMVFYNVYTTAGLGVNYVALTCLAVPLFSGYLTYWDARHCGPLVWGEGATEGQLLAVLIGFMSSWTTTNAFLHWHLFTVAGFTVEISHALIVIGLYNPCKASLTSFVRVANSKQRQGGYQQEVGFLAVTVASFVAMWVEFHTNVTVMFVTFLAFTFALSHWANIMTVYDVVRVDSTTTPVCWAFLPLPIASAAAITRPSEALHTMAAALTVIALCWLVFAARALFAMKSHLGVSFWVVRRRRAPVSPRLFRLGESRKTILHIIDAFNYPNVTE